MTPFRFRHWNKTYWRVPFGELQYGHESKSLVLWFRHRRYILRRGHVR